jgi:hypothetical protein
MVAHCLLIFTQMGTFWCSLCMIFEECQGLGFLDKWQNMTVVVLPCFSWSLECLVFQPWPRCVYNNGQRLAAFGWNLYKDMNTIKNYSHFTRTSQAKCQRDWWNIVDNDSVPLSLHAFLFHLMLCHDPKRLEFFSLNVIHETNNIWMF